MRNPLPSIIHATFSTYLVVAMSFAYMPASPLQAADPTIVNAEPAPQWNSKFEGKSGWIGGDGVYSVELGPDRLLWLFGDTLIGAVKDGRRTGAVIVNNTVALQVGLKPDAPIRFITGTWKDGKPAAVITPADGKGWFWPQGAILLDHRLFLFLPQIDKGADPGVLGFRQVAQWLAVVENPLDEPDKWRVTQHKIPAAKFASEGDRSFGSAVLAAGGHVYIYGYMEGKKGIGSKHLIVARVAAAKVEDFIAWQYRTADGWSDAPTDAVALADGLATEFSVTRMPDGKGFVLVQTQNGLSDRIIGRFSDTPEGPWSAPLLLYKCPEMAADKGVFSYAGKAHPWAANGNELLLSYCVNSWEFRRLFADEKVYRPRFVRVKFGARE